MTECELTRRLCGRLAAEGVVVLPYVAGAMCPAGVPDRWVCHPDFEGWVEFKRPGERPRPIQEHVIGRLRAAGAKVAVIEISPGELRCGELSAPWSGVVTMLTKLLGRAR